MRALFRENSTGERLVIVVPESEEKITRDLLNKLAVSEWEESIRLVGGKSRQEKGKTARQEAEYLLRCAADFEAERLIVTKEVFCDRKLLRNREELQFHEVSVGHLRRNIVKDELNARGLCWRRNLEDRLRHWDSKKSGIDEWLRQFDRFGGRWLGEALLRLLDVIVPDELSDAFRMPPQVGVGSNLNFTYLRDQDPASSSNRIGAMLTRMYGHTKDFVENLTTTPAGSRLVLCEDALWTGTEAIRLMERLAVGGDLHGLAQGKRVLLRHCVVSDYGIWACRHFIEQRDLDSVDLWLGDKQRYVTVMRPNLADSAIRSQWQLSPGQFGEWLTNQVVPQVFHENGFWGERQLEARRICELLGRQLVDRYVSEHHKEWSSTVKERFSIGAGGLGCSIVFAHSVPKVCLPLYWLGGEVTINSTTMRWHPLFYDARRN